MCFFAVSTTWAQLTEACCRALVLPGQVPPDSRSEAYCSFDGKSRQQLHPGDSLLILMSQWPVPMVCNLDASHDWFLSVRDGLNWNVRKAQAGRHG